MNLFPLGNSISGSSVVVAIKNVFVGIFVALIIGAVDSPLVDHIISRSESLEWTSIGNVPDHPGLNVIFHTEIQVPAVSDSSVTAI